MTNRFISWKEYNEKCDNLIEQIKDSESEFTHVVAVMRGGFYVANRISEALEIPLLYVDVKSYDKKNQQGEVVITNIIGAASDSSDLENVTTRLLIVDDLVDSGKTLREITRRLSVPHATAVLFEKSGSRYCANYVADRAVLNDTWLVQPFESDYVEPKKSIDDLIKQIEDTKVEIEKLRLDRSVERGSIVKLTENGTEYIVSMVSDNMWCLISLTDGNRYSNAMIAENIFQNDKVYVDRDVVLSLFNGRDFVVVRKGSGVQ